MKVDVIISPRNFSAANYRQAVVVAVDVLRATSVIVTALDQGCAEILPVAEIDEARRLAGAFPRGRVLLAGERKALKIDGFDLGNSPGEFTRDRVFNKSIVLTTTNGTRIFQNAREAWQTLVLSLLNLRMVVNHLQMQKREVYVLCAGRDGAPSLEDTVCAGMLVERLMETHPDRFTCGPGAAEALQLAQAHKSDLLSMMRLSEHGAYLEKIGFAADLELCARLNAIQILPLYRNGSIQRFKKRMMD